MKTIGIIGGISWESTQHYYEVMNRYVHTKLGGYNSIEALIYSINMERIVALHEDWTLIEKLLIETARKLQAAGAELVILTANTIHKVFPQVERSIHIPMLHIADPTAQAIQSAGLRKVGLLGTKITMEDGFYAHRLQAMHGIETVIPEKEDRELLQRIIFEELVVGKLVDSSKKQMLDMIDQLVKQGAQAVILGCTELSLLVGPKDTKVRLFDTTELHAKAAVDWAISKP